MKMNLNTWVPFLHENLEYKQKVLEIARQRDSNQVEHILTATLIYVNAVDYVASHLLTNLRQISYFVLHEQLNASVFYANKKQNNNELPLGKAIEKLRKYEFPDKDEFLGELDRFRVLRNKYVHNFLNIPAKDLEEKIGLELSEIYELAESILNRYDAIVRGITTTWIAYRAKQMPLPEPKK